MLNTKKTYLGRRVIPYIVYLMEDIGGVAGAVQCKYCGARSNSISNLTAGHCPKGGHHVPRRGGEKTGWDTYSCRYCGRRAWDVEALASGVCSGREDGGSCVVF